MNIKKEPLISYADSATKTSVYSLPFGNKSYNEFIILFIFKQLFFNFIINLKAAGVFV